MAVEITMPQLSDTMSQGTILNWLKKEGDRVKRGDALAEVETDKANLEIEAFHEGVLQRIIVPEGKSVEIGTVIAIIGKEGEVTATNVPENTASQPIKQNKEEVVKVHEPEIFPAGVEYREVPSTTHASSISDIADNQHCEERIKASPLARNVARVHNVELRNLSGSGEGGRIVRRDVEKAIESESRQNVDKSARPDAPSLNAVSAKSSVPVASGPSGQSVPAGVQPMSKMRATIAQRMVESVNTIPHFYTTARVFVDNLIKVRSTLKSLPQYEGITYNHFIIKAVALAMKKVPRINSAYSAEGILQPSGVNIGIVTAVSDGLLIPVLKDTQDLSLADVVAEAKGLVQRARSGKPKPTDLVGGTFSVSNMGAYNVEQFTAIISPGQGAILAISPIQEEPVVRDGQIQVGSTMRLTLSVDHRIIDGVMCGEFLTELKRLLEEPILLLA